MNVPIVHFSHPEALLAIPVIIVLILMLMPRTFIQFKDKEEERAYKEKKRGVRRLLIVSRILLITLIIGAIAGPYISTQVLDPGKPKLLLLVDNSLSMSLFKDEVGQLKSGLEKFIPVEMRNVGFANRSDLGDAIVNNMQGNDNLMIISDGNVNAGRSLSDVLLFASSLNTTVNALSLQVQKPDSAVQIIGPSLTTTAVDNRFDVLVSQAGLPAKYKLSVTLDGRQILTDERTGAGQFNLTQRLPEGFHKLEARIELGDTFQENNVFYKTVKVMPRPKVLYISADESPILQLLNANYELDRQMALPSSINGYAATILDDIPAERLTQAQVDQLSTYVQNGNGLVVFGGESSYDRGKYKGSMLETLLPGVIGFTGKGEETGINLVITIDISGSSGSTFSEGSYSSVEDVEKALAIGLLRDLKDTDKVGIVAFNTDAYVVSELSQLGPKRDELIGKIKRLRYFGGTLVDQGIRTSDMLLANVQGGKNIILLSDGLSGGLRGDDRDSVYAASFKGIKVYTVGVGSSTDADFMKELASIGKGAYYEPKESQKLKLVLDGSLGEDTSYDVEVVNYGHNITHGLQLKAKVSGFNYLVPKSNAVQLVSTGAANPLVTVWWMGLGRVAAITTDSGQKWAGEMLRKPNSLLYTRTINWAVGDPSRGMKYDLKLRDARAGEPVVALVRSDENPGSQFAKVADGLYTAQYYPTAVGFTTILDAPAAVNYPAELSELDVNPELERMVAVTGGKFFTANQVDEIIQKVKKDSERVRSEQTSLAWILTSIALGLFLLELLIRRFSEGR